jgi:hypothetical protein
MQPQKMKKEVSAKQPHALPHPNAVYAVIAIAVLLALTVFTPTNINAAATGLSKVKPPEINVPDRAQLDNIKLCGDICGDVGERMGVYAVLDGQISCVSIEEFQNNRYCCYDLDCPQGSSCVNGICG